MKNTIPKSEHGHIRATLDTERLKNTRHEPSHLVLLACLVLVLLSSLVSGRAGGGQSAGVGLFRAQPMFLPTSQTQLRLQPVVIVVLR